MKNYIALIFLSLFFSSSFCQDCIIDGSTYLLATADIKGLKIGELSNGDSILIEESGPEFSKIKVGSKLGFVSNYFINCSLEEEEEETGCKYLKNGIDDMTGQVIMETIAKEICENLENRIKLTLYSNIYRIDETILLNFHLASTEIFSIQKQNKILIKFSDEEVITLNVIESAVGDYDNILNRWYLTMRCIISQEQSLKKLNSYSIDKIRLYLAEGYIDLETTSETRDEIMTLLNCTK